MGLFIDQDNSFHLAGLGWPARFPAMNVHPFAQFSPEIEVYFLMFSFLSLRGIPWP
jgi:hypothetical protein